VARAVAVEGAQMATQSHGGTVYVSTATSLEISRLTLEDSGSFVDQSRGTGVLRFNEFFGELGSGIEYRVVDSRFVHNQAARGGAIGVLSYEIEVAIQRCIFEVGARQIQF
jgi:hypothetical protein